MNGLIGKTLGPYQIVERIGTGGMATVYKAYQPALDRYVAIKILPTQLAETPGFSQRFQREAKAVARLEHPHILPIHDFGQEDNLSYLVLRYVEGGTLKDLLGKPLDLGQAARLIGEVAEALDYAHERGVIHRDVKPSNVLLDPEGRTFLTDFGVARILEATQQLTGTGVGVGTPVYMSPEQGQGRKVDRRSDVYSLGIVLYEMLTGEVPYQAETPIAVVLKHINDPLPLPRKVNPRIPEPVERVVLKALAKSPEDRFQTAREMARALDAAVRDARNGGRPVSVESRSPREEAPKPLAVPALQAARRAWWIVPVILAVAGGALLVTSGLLVSMPTSVPETSRQPETATVLGALTSTVRVAETSGPEDSTIYDDFDDPAFDGAINGAVWLTEEDCSQVAQEAGAMVFRTRSSRELGCVLVLGRPRLLSVDQLGALEARIKIAPDHQGGWLSQTVDLETGALPGGIWWASCGLTAQENGASYWFDVRNYGAGKPSEVSQLLPAEFDQWYTMRLEVDPDTMRFTCTADGIVVGTIIPADSEALRGASFERQLGSHRVANAYATTYVDSVRSIPRQRASQATVPASPGAPTATIPYMTPMPGADTTIWQHIVFNLDDSIVGELPVRQAIAYGTDRQALGDAWAPPYRPVVLNSYIRPDNPYYAGDANLTIYPFDPDMANKILSEAGWVDGNSDGIREGAGTALRLRYITNQAPQRVALAEAFQSQMMNIGIAVEIEVYDFKGLMERVTGGDFQLAQFAWGDTAEAAIPTAPFVEGCEDSILHSACIPTTSTDWKGTNVSRLQSGEMDRLLEALLMASTFEEKRALLIQTQAVFTRELPMLPLFCNPKE